MMKHLAARCGHGRFLHAVDAVARVVIGLPDLLEYIAGARMERIEQIKIARIKRGRMVLKYRLVKATTLSLCTLE